MNTTWLALLSGFCCLMAGRSAGSQEVSAVLSSDSSYYREALAGFQEAFAEPVAAVKLDQRRLSLSSIAPAVVVAFGSKAALAASATRAAMVFCMSLGAEIPERYWGPTVNIPSLPAPAATLAKLKEIQPRMTTLAAVWASKAYEDDARRMRLLGARMGVSVLLVRLHGPEAAPDALRSLRGRAQALWLFPDPKAINAQSFEVFKSYSWANRVPLYAASPGLAERGATASLAAGYNEIGRTAARAAREILDGKFVSAKIYPERTEVTINSAAARNCGLEIPKQALAEAKVLP
ncbi:MAG: hypothetical protein HY921_06660 [Elusimicrobia bacterium]|nr:hypothetical protein [Elusimicrobiota bacterium]